MKPGGGGVPQGELAKLIERDFGSFDAFKKEFKQAGAAQFGSGWAWLVPLIKTQNAMAGARGLYARPWTGRRLPLHL